MKRTAILFVVLAIQASLRAQLHEKIIIKAGSDIAEAISPTGFYRFAQFTEGSFTMKDGTHARAMFNYHIGTGEMEYLGDKGDTLAIGVPEDITVITIGENVQYIYNNKSYLEIIARKKPAALAKKIRVVLENEKKGGYGESQPASSQTTFKNITMSSGIYQLSHDIAIIKTTSFYWIDAKNNLQPVSKKSSLKLVSKDKQPQLEAYIEEQNINFNSEEDLLKLLNYSETL